MLLASKYRKLLLFCFVFFQLSCFSKRNDAQQLPLKAAALTQDFAILQKTLEEAHPGLYWYTDRTAMNSFFDSTKALLNHDMTRVEFFKILLPLIATIKCLHTNLRLPNNVATNQFTRFLPFDFFCHEGKLYIRTAFNSVGREGTEVLSINNTDTKKILQTLLKSTPADGYNETFKYHLLSNGAFREGYALFFGQPQSFTIQSIDNSNRKFQFSVPALSPQKMSSINKTSPPPFGLNFYQKTALLSVNTFEMDTKQFGDSIATIFQIINQKGAEHLVIDLRQNGGGTNDNVSSLYSYTASGPFLHLKRAEMNAVSLTYPQFITNFQRINKFRKGVKKKGIYVVNNRYAGTSKRNPANKNLFKGSIVLLTSGNTTSAASEFAAIAHYLKRARIVGEETGGCYYGANGGNYLNLRLPNSGLEVRVPTIRIFTAVDEDLKLQPKGRGTFPDYQISPTITDVINGKDVQLDKAINILKN